MDADGGVTISLSGMLALTGLLLTAGTVIAASVWAVATIKGTTLALGIEMRGLADSIDRLRKFVTDETKELRDSLKRLDGRLIRMETRNGMRDEEEEA